MHKMEVVLAILDSNGGAIGNRTVLMKLGYFASLKAGRGGILYKDYFYGPFSKELALGIEDARAALLVDETVRSSPIESYAYSLTDDGREIAKRVRSTPKNAPPSTKSSQSAGSMTGFLSTRSHSPQRRTTGWRGQGAGRIAPVQESRGWRATSGGT